MEQKIMFLLFFKISGFIFFLSCISHFNNEASTFIKYLGENYNNSSKIDKINYRLLAKYKQYKNYNDVGLNENIQNKWEHQEKNIYNNKKLGKGKNKQSNRSLLNKSQYYTEYTDYNNGMFDGKHFHFEKKWIKKKDYDDYVEKKRRICDISLKKLKFRNYGYVVAIFIIISFFGIGILVLSGMNSLDTVLTSITEFALFDPFKNDINTLSKSHKYCLLGITLSTIIITLSIIVVKAICKILINNEKYIKFRLMND
ncbi:uncharacterized protein MKS88_000129 [Plasmodium brasilianum]|uniref:uncharacterized protein n=1 Tax=Plasmodium brasilianum TaxID=5824 RepID=UPI00350E512B|nr:hypothetical protein MKS88_000129 [Plasmodium brasilianum]